MRSYRIENFRSFVDSGEIEVKPITIFVGKNSCGKSSLLRFPAVLAQTFNMDTGSPLQLYGKLVDYGTYEDAIHKGQDGLISYSLTYGRIVPADLIDQKSSLIREIQTATLREVTYEQEQTMIMAELNKSGDIDESTKRQYEGKLEMLSKLRKQQIEKKSSLIRRLDLAEKRISQERVYTCHVTIAEQNHHIIVHMVELFLGETLLYRIERTSGGKYGDYKYTAFCRYEHDYIRPEEKSFIGNASESGIFLSMNETELEQAINRFIDDDTAADDVSSYDFAEDGLYRKSIETEKITEDEIDNMCSLFKPLNDLLRQIEEMAREEAKKLVYIGPFRANPERTYRDPEYRTGNVGVNGENVSNLLIRDYYDKGGLLDKVSEWTQKVLGYRLAIRELSNGLFQLMLEDDKGFQTNIIDNGYGVSQVLPILLQIIKSSYEPGVSDAVRERFGKEALISKMVVIEQPELHLHPAAQAELADLFAAVATANEEKNDMRLLIETHSEHLIRKLQVLIADKNCALTNDMVKIYYVDKDENGVANVKEMKILENGKFAEKWPTGFFDKSQELTMELLRASAIK